MGHDQPSDADKLWAELSTSSGPQSGSTPSHTSPPHPARTPKSAASPASISPAGVDARAHIQPQAGASAGSVVNDAASDLFGKARAPQAGTSARAGGEPPSRWPVAAIVAGGVVLLALVVMVGVYVLTTRSRPATGRSSDQLAPRGASPDSRLTPPSASGSNAGGQGAPLANVDASRAGKININTASAAELALLPGVGKSIAEAIVAYRGKHGPFKSVAELDKVPGIGPKKLADISKLASVD